MSKKYDLSVYIGRFQPFHAGHSTTLRQAIDIAEHTLVLVGSARKAPDVKNPFSYLERKGMILSSTPEHIFVEPIVDYTYSNNTWIEQVQRRVKERLYDLYGPGAKDKKVVLVGHDKEDTFYLKFFPQWDFYNAKNYRGIVATKIRDRYFEGHTDFEVQDQVTPATLDFLRTFAKTSQYAALCKEHEFLKAYKKQFEAYPYPPTFVTCDAVVLNKGHVLVVKRKQLPGKGLWALPGGFLNQDEWVNEGIIRELKEETKIRVHEDELRRQLVTIKTFDAPGRSLRGRTITHAGLILLDKDLMPEVKGSDDAEHAVWMPFEDVRMNPETFFEDHFSIISTMLNITADRPQGF